MSNDATESRYVASFFFNAAQKIRLMRSSDWHPELTTRNRPIPNKIHRRMTQMSPNCSRTRRLSSRRSKRHDHDDVPDETCRMRLAG
jgi:hypothetical protein